MTPKPTGITSQVLTPNAWYYVTWDDVPGTDVRYECHHEGEAASTELRKPESALIAVPKGTTRYTRIRNIVDGVPSGWVKVTLNDKGEIVDIDGDDPTPGKPPNPPRNLDAVDVTATATRLVWDPPEPGGTDVDHYHVSWSRDGAAGEQTTVTDTELALDGLTPDAAYAAAVTAVSAASVPSKAVHAQWRTQPDGTDPETPPAPPSGLHVVSTDPEYASVTVGWHPQGDADYWEVLLDDVYPRYRRANSTEYVFSDLTDGTQYSYRVRAVRKSPTSGKLLRSAPTRGHFTYDGHTPPPVGPQPPRNVRAHCITDTSTKVEWDLDAGVYEYRVWIEGMEDAAQTTQGSLVTVVGLSQATAYTALVTARDRAGNESRPGSVWFRTGIPEPDPDPDPEVPTEPDWPAPTLMIEPLEGGRARATWDDPPEGTPPGIYTPSPGRKPTGAMGYPFWHVSTDQATWFFTRDRQHEFEIPRSGEVQVSVYGVWDNTLTGIATKGVAL